MAKIHELLLTLPDVIKKRAPDFKVKYKDESTLMKFLGVLLFFIPRFMKRTTVILSTVYFPSRRVVQDRKTSYGITLAHEYVHILDSKEHPVKFVLSYFFPQILAVFSLLSFLAFINLWFLLCLLFLVCLAPLPSSGRTELERRGFYMTTLLEFRRDGGFLPGIRDSLMKSFSGWSYYRMTSSANANKIVARMMQNARAGVIPTDSLAYQDVINLIERPSVFEDGEDRLNLLCRLSEPPDAYDS